MVTAIEQAAAKGEVEDLKEALHSFKSSTANLGGLRLATLTRECEGLVREGGVAKAAPSVQKIRREYQDFCSALMQERSTNAA